MLRKVLTHTYLSVDAGPLLTDKLQQFLMKCDSPKRAGVVIQVNSCITVLPPGVGGGGGGRGGTEVMMVGRLMRRTMRKLCYCQVQSFRWKL